MDIDVVVCWGSKFGKEHLLNATSLTNVTRQIALWLIIIPTTGNKDNMGGQVPTTFNSLPNELRVGKSTTSKHINAI